MTRTIRILKDDYDRFVEIQKQRPQDTTNAETFNYLLRIFEESPIRVEICKTLMAPRHIIPGNVSSPIIDADNLRIVTPTILADRLRKEAQDLAHKAAQDAPTKKNMYKENTP